MKNIGNKLKYPQLIILVFALIILLGTVLLMLPVSSREGTSTSLIDALFTATSANCITGLVVFDTYSHWSLFGQIVILFLMQIGGLGFMSVATIFSFAFRRKIGLNERMMMQEAVGSVRLGGVVRLTKHVLLGTLFFELLGTILLAARFCPKMGIGEGLYNALFHSVSAFCNAGFDLMGKYRQFSSLTAFSDDPVVCMTVASLVVIGGLGFLVWEDILIHKWKFKQYLPQTKAVLITTAVLTGFSSLFIFFVEKDITMADMNIFEKIYNSFFHAVTPRTAGFNSLDITMFSDLTIFLTVLLMFVGGSPGSTAGGVKTTVVFLMFIAVISTLKGKKDITAFKRRYEDELLKKAFTITALYLSFAVIAIILISMFQDFKLIDVVFEVFSALSTGMTLGITTSLSIPSKIIVIILMYFGRAGLLSVIFMFLHPNKDIPIRYPLDKINIV